MRIVFPSWTKRSTAHGVIKKVLNDKHKTEIVIKVSVSDAMCCVARHSSKRQKYLFIPSEADKYHKQFHFTFNFQ